MDDAVGSADMDGSREQVNYHELRALRASPMKAEIVDSRRDVSWSYVISCQQATEQGARTSSKAHKQ